jgi:hypothetical protein
MWAGIIALFPTLAGWINLVIGWFQARSKAQDDANSAEEKAIVNHQNDGAQSVEDKNSADAQNQSLDDLKKQLDNPIPIIVEKGKP